MPGQLSIIATPLGHREDITLRALATLKHVAGLVCERPSHTQKLLHMYNLRCPLIPYTNHNALAQTPKILAHLHQGEHWGLVSDQGMPCISDPGHLLVDACHTAGITVTVLPGPCSVSSAVALSGYTGGAFYFQGFLPRQGKANHLLTLKYLPCPIVIFEAPGRITDTLREIYTCWGDRSITLARELTKLHETVHRTPISHYLDSPPTWRGEMVLVVQGADPATQAQDMTETWCHILQASSKKETLHRLKMAFPFLQKKKLYAALHGDDV